MWDGAGVSVYNAGYDPYGLPMYTQGSATALGFAGEYTDVTGLVFLRARYMDPRTGSFLSRDPVWGMVGLSASYNPYAYAFGNPVNLTDPSGQFPMLFGAAVGAVVSAGVDLLTQMILGGKSIACVDWNSVKAAAITGAISGAFGGMLSALGATPLQGALINFTVDFTYGSYLDMTLMGKSHDEAVLNNLISAGIGAGLGYVFDSIAFEGRFSSSSSLDSADDNLDSYLDDVTESVDNRFGGYLDDVPQMRGQCPANSFSADTDV